MILTMAEKLNCFRFKVIGIEVLAPKDALSASAVGTNLHFARSAFELRIITLLLHHCAVCELAFFLVDLSSSYVFLRAFCVHKTWKI